MADNRNSDSRVNSSKGSEPNAQNSELDPNQHPSGARIEQMTQDTAHAKDEPAEGGRDEFNSESLESPSDERDRESGASEGHRTTPETRTDSV